MPEYRPFDQPSIIEPKAEPVVFESGEPYSPERVHAAAIYCSDGRFGTHCDDFLHNCLALPRYDRLVIPGGPANLAGHFLTYRESEALSQQLAFLIEVHRLDRIVLIAHEGCAFYAHRLSVAPANVAEQQRQDMRKAAQRIQSLSSRLAVQGYMARQHGERIVFEAMPLEPASTRLVPTSWI